MRSLISMENKQTIIVGIVGVLLLGLVLDMLIIPLLSGNYDIQALMRIIRRDTEGVLSKTKIEKLSENPVKLKKEVQRIVKDIENEKEHLKAQIQQKKEKINEKVNKLIFEGFNYTDFDQKLNEIIQDNGFEVKIGIPQTDIDVERIFTFDDQSTKVKKVKVKYQEIAYPLMQVNFITLKRFIDKLNEYKKLPLSELEIVRYDQKDGFVDANIKFLIIKEMIGLTKTNKEVTL